MTKITTATPQGDCPTWMSFLKEVTRSDGELMAYLQRMAGYCLTGITSEHALFFLYGTGANGKSVFVNTLSAILGDYATNAPMDTFMETRSDRHPTDLAGLRGARLVSSVETEQGRRWAESKIKALTGGDKIAARFMRQDFFEYVPQFKLVVAAIVHPIRWICPNHVHELVIEQGPVVGGDRGVAAEQFVLAEEPEISWLRDRALPGLERLIVVGESRTVRLLAVEQLRELVRIETDETEIEIVLPERLELDPQELLVPRARKGKLVVRDHVSALLRLREMRKLHDRDLLEAQLAGRQQPPVARDHAVPAVHQDRIGPAELHHACRDLGDLHFGVCPGVPCAWQQSVDRPELDLEIREVVTHRRPPRPADSAPSAPPDASWGSGHRLSRPRWADSGSQARS